ncbi:hypothetical protein NUACC21_68180 [Scytonema sp. NUACC21]
MKWSIEKKTIVGLLCVSIVMVSVDLFSFIAAKNHREISNGVVNTHQALHSIEKVISSLKDAETRHYIYLITGKENDLESYNTTIVQIDKNIQELRKLTTDRLIHQQIISKVENLVSEKTIAFKETVDMRKEKGLSTGIEVFKIIRQKNDIDSISLLESEIEEVEKKLLKQRLQQEVVAHQIETIASLSGTCLTVVLFYAIVQATLREIRDRREAQKTLAASNEELETKIMERTVELTQMNKKLLDFQEQLLKTQQELYKVLASERELNHLKSQIITTVSHEYRTPLTIILSGAELLQKYEQKLTEEQKNRQLRSIQTSAKHMANLVNDMLFINQAELNQLTYNPSSVNLIELCKELVEKNSSFVSSKINIDFSIFGTCERVCLDKELLQPMLLNLLSNAIKYSHQGGAVSFKVECTNGSAQFLVRDFGIGIPEADIGHIFEFFYRGSNVGNIGGTGIGLAVAKKCVDLHQGSISVESFVNQGTTFIVTLPCV